jgi:hypothetical protein
MKAKALRNSPNPKLRKILVNGSLGEGWESERLNLVGL